MYLMVWSSKKNGTEKGHIRHAIFLNENSANDYFNSWEQIGYSYVKLMGKEIKTMPANYIYYPQTYLGYPKEQL